MSLMQSTWGCWKKPKLTRITWTQSSGNSVTLTFIHKTGMSYCRNRIQSTQVIATVDALPVTDLWPVYPSYSYSWRSSCCRFVTRRELLFVVATVKPMEHCLAPFLDLCDANKDRKISLYEWGGCLGLNQGTVYWCIAGSRISERGITVWWSWSSDSVVSWFRD